MNKTRPAAGTVALSGITGTGTLGITLAAGTASDMAGNPARASSASTTFPVTPNVAPSFTLPAGTLGPAGVTWTARASNRGWSSVASSADGSKLVAGVRFDQIYTSTDSGATWTARDSSRDWRSVASSSDGSKLAAVVDASQIYTSAGSAGLSTITVPASSGLVTSNLFVTAISAGPPSEASQTVSFTVTTDNNALFGVAPAIGASGTLTFTPLSTASGTATVTVFAQDNGGTANGGVDTSATQTFTLTVTVPPNTAPVAGRTACSGSRPPVSPRPCSPRCSPMIPTSTAIR